MKKKMLALISLVLLLALFTMPAVLGNARTSGEAAPNEMFSVGVITAGNPSDNTEAQEEFEDLTKEILYIVNKYVVRSLLIVGTVVFMIFGIINFIKYSKATEEEARRAAKKNLIGWGVGAVGMFACIWLLPLLFDFLISLMPAGDIKVYK